MRVACLISGGKDSMLALHKASEKHEIACLISIFSRNPDSYMFHTANIEMTDAIAMALEKPLFKVFVSGEEEKEVDELSEQLSVLDVDGIVIGGIRSEYQKKRFEYIAESLNLELISPLWHVDEEEIVREVGRLFDAIIVKTSAMGLDDGFLGRRIDEELLKDLKRLNEKYGVNVAGEGGEYESLVLDAPLYRKRIEILSYDVVRDGLSSQMVVREYRLVEKS
ncbi:metal-binding-domain/4Fe-4S-binding-domain containing ABC transporter, ATP-binding protein [Geoglobus ahangari]|uniref:Metal-binding-domain/4Fe-4S-binding-domain containing ABC transporter, ATP-binding protein n=1 Tax=Geoglobus ahangari TaxID=113653 RepID=A0A0F7ICM1_9EURY|nr:TIGR00289 family protein [Geoglobus ahangari]AKG91033.1 metal-binding-domain/4Fe-4S-binding-domain containing ABC transporter, ATP-binding protein [Geoglobus ahangari]